MSKIEDTLYDCPWCEGNGSEEDEKGTTRPCQHPDCEEGKVPYKCIKCKDTGMASLGNGIRGVSICRCGAGK